MTSADYLERTRGQTRVFDRDSGEAIQISRTEPNPSLIQAVVQSEFWRRKLVENPDTSLADILTPFGLKTEQVRRHLNIGQTIWLPTSNGPSRTANTPNTKSPRSSGNAVNGLAGATTGAWLEGSARAPHGGEINVAEHF